MNLMRVGNADDPYCFAKGLRISLQAIFPFCLCSLSTATISARTSAPDRDDVTICASGSLCAPVSWVIQGNSYASASGLSE
jgi:hypothetical protein